MARRLRVVIGKSSQCLVSWKSDTGITSWCGSFLMSSRDVRAPSTVMESDNVVQQCDSAAMPGRSTEEFFAYLGARGVPKVQMHRGFPVGLDQDHGCILVGGPQTLKK